MSLPDLAWNQATLPIWLGDLGLREACRTTSAAFIWSCNSSHTLFAHLLGSAIAPVTGQDSSSAFMSEHTFEVLLPTKAEAFENLAISLPDTVGIDLLTSSQRQIQVLDKTCLLDILWEST